MKARELIEELKKLDPEIEVYVVDSEFDPEPVALVAVEQVTSSVNPTTGSVSLKTVTCLYP